MANIKSSKKRVLIAERNRARNIVLRSSIKTAVKRVLEAVKEGKTEEAKAELSVVYKLYDKAVGKKVVHKNNAARKKSRLTKKVNA